MLKGPQHDSGAKAGSIVIDLPESVKKKLPRDFNIDEIGKIDLREAETIASEDILFINENEIIEGLEDFDLIPLKNLDTGLVDVPEETAKPGAVKATDDKPRKRHDATAGRIFLGDEEGDYDDEYTAGAAEKVNLEIKRKAEARKDAEEQVKGQSREYDDGRMWVPVEKVLSGSEAESAAEQKKPQIMEGYVESDDEYIIWDLPPDDFEAPKTEKKTEQRELPSGGRGADKSEEAGKGEAPAATAKEISRESPKPIVDKGMGDAIQRDHGDVTGAPMRDVKQAAAQAVRTDAPGKTAPAQKREASREKGEVVFVDDRTGMRSDDRSVVAGDGDLDKIISGIVRFDEGPSYVLGEAGVEEDRERIALLTEDLAPLDEELFVDLEYKYGDEELDYIHTAIAEEDFGNYISEIDEFFGTRGGRTVPTRVELLGLTADEFDTIEDLLFKGDFKDIHLFDRYQLYEFDRGAREGKSRGNKSCRYLLPAENSIMDVERDSIESDISAGSALIFEEDVEEIKEQLRKRTGKSDIEIAAMLERAERAGAVEEQVVRVPKEKPSSAGMEEEAASPEPEPERNSPSRESVFDITDRVVILDDKADVERFISGFPEPKQMNIKMLLKYLDGLFEKLPEETIKKFASSDYFELYLKVLNELGV